MRRPITYAELLLLVVLVPLGWIGSTHLYEYVTDRISIECSIKKNKMGGSKPSAPTVIMPAETKPQQFQTVIPEKSFKRFS